MRPQPLTIISLILLVTIPLIIFILQKQQDAPQKDSTVSVEDPGNNAGRVIELMNAERVKEGLAPLKFVEELAVASDNHNKKMNECAASFGVQACFEHQVTQLNELPLLERVKQTGYLAKKVGENIARGQQTPEQAVQIWMQSKEGHREAILNTDMPDVGCAFLRGGNGNTGHFFWTCDFGNRRNTGPTPTSKNPTNTPVPTHKGPPPTPDPTLLLADVDRDGCVGILDFNAWFQAIKNKTARSGTFPDINKDGSVTIVDFNLWFKAMISLPKNKLC